VRVRVRARISPEMASYRVYHDVFELDTLVGEGIQSKNSKSKLGRDLLSKSPKFKPFLTQVFGDQPGSRMDEGSAKSTISKVRKSLGDAFDRHFTVPSPQR
jgi:hypothetical protein